VACGRLVSLADMIIAQIVTLAAAAIACRLSCHRSARLPDDGQDPSLASILAPRNAVPVGVILLAITTTVNALSVRVTALVNSTA